MPDFSKMTTPEFSLWLGNFIAVANLNLVALGLTAADITALQALKTDLDAKLAAQEAAKAAAVASTAALKTSRKNAQTQASFRNKALGANPAIPNALKELLGLDVADTTPTPILPLIPVDLSVVGFSNGINRLKWRSGGNKRGTTYVIEARTGAAGSFQVIHTTTKTSYDHPGQTPGVPQSYRIKARRTDADSGYSNVAVVY